MPIGLVKNVGHVARAIAPMVKSTSIAALRSSEVQRIRGGVSSGYKTAVSWLERALKGRLTFEKMNQIYERNVWVRACVDKTVRRLTVIDPIIKTMDLGEPTDEQKRSIEKVVMLLQDPNDRRESFTSIRQKYFRDVLIYDAGCMTIDRNANPLAPPELKGVPLALYSAPGDEIRLNVDATGGFANPEKAYSQIQRGSEVEIWEIDELVYFIANPRAGTVYGFSPIESLVQTVTAELFASAYNIDFFANQATPRLAVLFSNMGEGETAESKLTRFQYYWEQELQGKPHKPIFVGSETGEVKIQPMNMSNEDMQFQEYSYWLLAKIMAPYNMQPLVLGIITPTTGKLNSQEQREQFKEDALKPMLKLEAYHLNSELIWPEDSFGYRDIYLDYDAVDLIDLKAMAEIWTAARKGGWLLVDEIRNVLGKPPLPHIEEEPYEPQDKDLRLALAAMTDAYVKNLSPDDARLLRPVQSQKRIPTGLERMEKSEEREAIEEVLRRREEALSKQFIVGAEEYL